MFVLTLGSTDTDDKPVATAVDDVAARYHAYKILKEILVDAGQDGEYKTVRLPQYDDGIRRVFGNIHVGESVNDTFPTMVDWVYVTDVPEVVAP